MMRAFLLRFDPVFCVWNVNISLFDYNIDVCKVNVTLLKEVEEASLNLHDIY